MEVIIDRFEGEYAVVEIEKGKLINIPRILVPDAKEGDTIKIIVDKEATKKRQEHVKDLVNDLFID